MYLHGKSIFPDTRRPLHVLANTRADQKKGKLLTENSSWKSNKLQTARK